MIKKLLRGAKGYEKESILTVVFVLLESALEVILPLFMSTLLNTLQYYGAEKALSESLTYFDFSALRFAVLAEGQIVSAEILTNTVITYGILMVLSSVCSLAFGVYAGKFAAIASTGFSKNIRREMFAKIQDFSFSNVDKFSTASLVTRTTTDVNNAQQAFMMMIRTVIRTPAMLIFSTIMAFVSKPDLAWLFLLAIPLLGVSMFLLIRKVSPMFMKLLKKYDGMNASVQENLVAMRVVKAFVREDYEEEKYRKTSDEVRQAQLKAERMMIMINPVSNTIFYGAIVALLMLGGSQIINETMLSGTLTAMMTYCTQILMSVMMICMIAVTLVRAKSSIDRIYEVLEEQPSIVGAQSDLQVADGSVEFKDVVFSYSGEEENPTLQNINLSIKSGETVGIIGGTGDGKSSLVQLIPRFYDVVKGEVLVGGENVKNYSLFNLREGVSMVLQKNVLFSGTIKSNLLWGNENATDEEIVAACKAACAHDFITSFPQGYETDLGQGGVNVSGGQKQRLCIARALLKKPKIMILDDSTSAVDTATDAKIRQGLKELDKDMTTIIIAQRISSVEHCDKIVVLDDGKINAVGTHEQLLETCTIYQEVYHSQQKTTVENEQGGESK